MSCARFEILARKGANKGDRALRPAPNQYRRQPRGMRQQAGARGPDAHQQFAEALARPALEVTLSTSGWLLRAGRCEKPPPRLAPANAWTAAVCKMRRPRTLQEIDPWHTRRNPPLDRGEHGLRSGHLDLPALPRR